MLSFTSNTTTVLFKKDQESAKLPERKSKQAAGYDLYLLHEVNVPPNGIIKAPTGLSLGYLNPNYYMRICPRSSTLFKWNVAIAEGVVDADYRGEVLLVLRNLDTVNACTIPANTAIAQALFQPIHHPIIKETSTVIDNTERGSQGFGSTSL